MENTLENLKSELSVIEIKTMLDVLNRNDEFRKNERERLRRLHVEVDCLKKILPRNEKSFLHCSLCNSIFIPILNSFYQCKICQIEICSNCVVSFKSPSEINLCKICHAERLQKMKSGKWLIEKSDTEKRDILIELGSKLSVMETEIRHSEQVIAERLQLSAVHKKLENILNNEEKDTRDEYSQFGSGRNSPTLHSYKSLSVENLSKFNIASGLKSKYQIRESKFKDDMEDNINDISSSNSTPSTSEPFYSISSAPKNNRFVNGFNINNKQIFEQMKRNSLSIRDSLHSVSQLSIKSYNSAAFTSAMVIQGEILVLIKFIISQSHLELTICECRDLALVKDHTNPFVKVYLLPDKSSSGKRKTSIKKNTVNPVFNEILHYHIDKASLNSRTFNISVWHNQQNLSRIFLGETNITLSNVDFSNPQNVWLPLRTMQNVPQLMSIYLYKGEILVGLRFVNNEGKKQNQSISTFESGTLTIFIRSGRNLGDFKNVPSSYVKCRVLYNHAQIYLNKTKTVLETTNPTWNAEFHYDNFDHKGLNDLELELTVFTKKKILKDFLLGKLYLRKTCCEQDEKDCKEKDVKLWRTFLDSPISKIIEDYLPLRNSME